MWDWLKKWWQGQKKSETVNPPEPDWRQLLQTGSERQQRQAALALLGQGDLAGLEPVLTMLCGKDPLQALEAMEALLAFPGREELAAILWSRLPYTDKLGQSRLLDWAGRAGLALDWLQNWQKAGLPLSPAFYSLAAAYGDDRYAVLLVDYWQQKPDWQRAEEIWQWASRQGDQWPCQAKEWLLPWIEQQPDNSLRRSWLARLQEVG